MDWVIHKFYEGGLAVMMAILLCLVIALVLITERLYRYFLQYDMTNSTGFMAAVQKMIMNNSIENAIRLCKKARPKLMPVVLQEGLKRANDSAEEMQLAMDTATLSALPKVKKYVPFLGTLANVATLSGLLGTISGLKVSFDAAGRATGTQKATLLANGINEALTATFFGLSVALFCLFFFGVLMIKQTAIVDDINQAAARLLDLLYTRKMKIRGSSETASQ